MRTSRLVPSAILLTAAILAAPVRATTVVVPDDYATIQAAIDAGADSVLVRDGTYAEHPTLPRSMALLTAPPIPQTGQPPFPKVAGLTVSCPSLAGPVLVRDFHFTGAVVLADGRTAVYDGRVHVRGCLVFGGGTLGPSGLRYVDVSENSIIGGGLAVDVDEAGSIRGNYIEGPAAAGIRIVSSDADILPISDNVITGTTDGVVIDARQRSQYGDYHDNVVRDCSGSAFRAFTSASMKGFPKLRHNTVRDCGGHGFELVNVYALIDSNDIENVGLDGVRSMSPGQSVVGNRIHHAAGSGIRLGDYSNEVSGNQVLDAGGDGIVQRRGALRGGRDPRDHDKRRGGPGGRPQHRVSEPGRRVRRAGPRAAGGDPPQHRLRQPRRGTELVGHGHARAGMRRLEREHRGRHGGCDARRHGRVPGPGVLRALAGQCIARAELAVARGTPVRTDRRAGRGVRAGRGRRE